MTEEPKKGKNLNVAFFIVGSICLIAGITVILTWWSDMLVVLRGGGGIILAIAGLYVLYAIKDNEKG